MIYSLLFPIIGLVLALITVFFRKKLIRDQIARASKGTSYFSRRLANYPPKEMENLALTGGIIGIIICIIKIILIINEMS